MSIILDGSTGITTPAESVAGNLSYTGTLTGNGGIVNIGSGQIYKDASGNVGFGTSLPATKLQVAGEIRSNSDISNSSDVTFYSYNGAAAGTVQAGIQFVGSGQNTRFYTNGTERARIDSSGNLLLGATSSSGNAGIQLLPSAQLMSINHIAGTSSGAFYTSFNYNGSQIGSIIQTGTTAVLYNTTSDYRLKDVVGSVTGAGERIDALEPIEYQWKADGSNARGFLAHKFQEVYPQSVSGKKDAVDEEGNPKYQTMQASTSEVIADLVAEIKSLRQRLAAANL